MPCLQSRAAISQLHLLLQDTHLYSPRFVALLQRTRITPQPRGPLVDTVCTGSLYLTARGEAPELGRSAGLSVPLVQL